MMGAHHVSKGSGLAGGTQIERGPTGLLVQQMWGRPPNRRPSRGRVRRLWGVGTWQRRGPHDLLRPPCPAAPRAGVGRHRRGRRVHGARAQGRGFGVAGVLGRRHRKPQGRPRHRPRALRHRRRPGLAGCTAAPLHHWRRDHRPGPQRHARELRRPAPPAY